MERRHVVLIWCLAAVPLLYTLILVWALAAGGIDAARTVIDETLQWQQLLRW